MSNLQKTLLIRIDRIGDLVCSLPVDQLPALKDHKCQWLITEGLEFIPEHSHPQRVYKTTGRSFSWRNFSQLRKWLHKENFTTSISFHAPWWINLALFISRVPQRLGNQSQWHSFLFLNKTLKQKRSQNQKHEAEYNQELVNFLITGEKKIAPHLFLDLKAQNPETTLEKYQLEPQSYIIVHPGMGGSALNWPVSSYCELITEISKKQKVVITGTSGDRHWISPIVKELKKQPCRKDHLIWLNEKLSSQELLQVLSQAQTVIAPSTGVAHLAASLGVSTIGLYPLINSQTPKRWSPRGKKVIVLTPPSAYSQNLEQMTKISVNQVLQEVQKT